MNTVKDLRQALSEEVRRMQPPTGLETRVHQALRSSLADVPARRSGRRGPFGSRESESVESPRLIALVAALLAIAIVISLVFAARALHPTGEVPVKPGPPGGDQASRSPTMLRASRTIWLRQGWKCIWLREPRVDDGRLRSC